MGYSRTIPFQILTHINTFPNTVSADPGSNDFTLGTFTSPDWDGAPTTAFIDLVIQTAHNTNANNNWIDNTNSADFALSEDLITYQSCGVWEQGNLLTPPTTWRFGAYRIAGTVNLATYLKPNTVYYAECRNMLAPQHDLDFYNTYAELKMVFGG